MLQSRLFIPTTKEVTKDQIKSFQLLQKSGMIKQLAAGVYTYLPQAYTILKNIETIIREELEAIDCYEMLMPTLQPKELWEESGRWQKYGAELMRMKDRHDREFCLGPTHEEVVVHAIRDHINSYKKLPLALFQIQTKFRDEKRPRFGLMRGREFIMMDAYSFHTDLESLDVYYDKMAQAYTNILNRLEISFRGVGADSGAIGGSGSMEFMALSSIGEDTIVYCDDCGYAVNLEKAESVIEPNQVEQFKQVEKVSTPSVTKIEDLAAFLNIELSRIAKTLVYIDDITSEVYLVVIRGDYEVNEVKLLNQTKAESLRLVTDGELVDLGLVKGYISVVDSKYKVVADKSMQGLCNFVSGANEVDYHLTNLNFDRDIKVDEFVDIREVKEFEKCCCGGTLNFAKGIEVGHIFKLQDTYSSKLGATYLDQNQKSQPIMMGCYGIGVSRLLMAIMEEKGHEKGIVWPESIQPFDYHVVIVDTKKAEQVELANQLYQTLKTKGYRVLLDDRAERVGSKFADSDLIGVRKRIIVGKKASENIVEYLDRKEDMKTEYVVEDLLCQIDQHN